MKNKAKIWITFIGLVLGAISYWRLPYDEMSLINLQFWLFVGGCSFGAALFSKLYFNQKPSQTALLISLGVILSIVFRIVYEVYFWDSTSHNLAPFEVILAILQSMPLAFAGAFLGKLIQKNKNKLL